LGLRCIAHGREKYNPRGSFRMVGKQGGAKGKEKPKKKELTKEHRNKGVPGNFKECRWVYLRISPGIVGFLEIKREKGGGKGPKEGGDVSAVEMKLKK